MTDDLKKEGDEYERDPRKVPAGRIGNFEIFEDTTVEPDEAYFAVSLLTSKIVARGMSKAGIESKVDELNKQIAEDKGKKNENCPFCAKKDGCKDKGDPTKVDCFEPPANNVFDMMG